MALSRDTEMMFSALGAGKLEEDINQLIQAPEEEEDFDVLNDETFGNLGDADYDWEDEHKRMAEELEGSSFFDTHAEGNRTRDSGFITMDRGISTSAQEDELERSLGRLVVEDSDSKAFTMSGRPIPGAQRAAHLDDLFGPNSPPGYMDLEALTSPTGKNIWGSPSGDGHFQKPVNNTLQALFASAKQAALRDFPTVLQDSRSPHQAPSLPAEAQTLAEIEHNMMAREHQKPKVLTAEEVERQLRGEPPLPSEPKNPFTMAAQIPPVGTAVAFRKQSNQGPLGMNPLGSTVPLGESSPINIIQPHGRGFPVYHGHESNSVGRSPSPSPSQLPPGVPPPPHPPFIAQSPHLMSPYNPATVMMGNRLFGSPMVRPSPQAPTHMPPPGVGSPLCSPYGSPSLMVSRQHLRNNSSEHGHNLYFNERRDYSYNHRSPGQHGHFYNRHPHESIMLDPTDKESEDPYAGLMTKKEKDWIIKIQLIQLQTDNPYLDDYYYTYHTMRKKSADRDRQQMDSSDRRNSELELIIPSMIKIEPRTYTPAQFEGSLGRLTAASVHNPRQIIDVCRNGSPTSEESGQKNVSKELRRNRQLLMDIEKCFNNILDVDDIEKKILALPMENRLPLFEERRDKIATVYNYFMHDESLKFKNFVPTILVRKGRKLLARLMPLLDKIQALDIVTVLLSHLPLLAKKDEGGEEGLQVLSSQMGRHMSQCDLEFLVHYATILQKHPEHNEEGISLLLHNTFGMSLLCSMIKAGEDYFKKTSPVDIDNQLKTKWAHFIEEFVESLDSVPMEQLAKPTMHQSQVADHVDRFVNNKLLGAVEDKLAYLASRPGISTTQSQEQGSVGQKVLSKPIIAAS